MTPTCLQVPYPCRILHSYVAADKTHKTCVAYYALRCDGAAKWSAKHVAFTSLFDDIESSSIKHHIRLEAPGGFEIDMTTMITI